MATRIRESDFNRKQEREEATSIVDYLAELQRKFPILYYKALSFSIECWPRYLKQREGGSELGVCL